MARHGNGIAEALVSGPRVQDLGSAHESVRPLDEDAFSEPWFLARVLVLLNIKRDKPLRNNPAFLRSHMKRCRSAMHHLQ